MTTRSWQWWWEVPSAQQQILSTLNDSQSSNSASSAYVHSADQLDRSISNLLSLGADRLFYAIKANDDKRVLQQVESRGLGFECVSLAELRHVTGLFPDLDKSSRLLFTPNFAAQHEYDAAFELGAFVTVDNVWLLEEWHQTFAGREVFVRIDPGKGKGHHQHVVTGGSQSKFGVCIDQLDHLKKLADQHQIRVTGLHTHVGSGVDDWDTWAQNARVLGSIKDQFFPDVKYLDLGGGFPVPCKPSDKCLDLAKVRQALSDARGSIGVSGLEIWLEPGRYVVAESGVLMTSVTQLKHKPGRSFVGCSAGMSALIRPALYSAYHHIVNLSAAQRDQRTTPVLLEQTDDHQVLRADVVGPICETGDVLGWDRRLPKSTRSGDWILVSTAGAYCLSMSSHYNRREVPPVIFLQSSE